MTGRKSVRKANPMMLHNTTIEEVVIAVIGADGLTGSMTGLESHV